MKKIVVISVLLAIAAPASVLVFISFFPVHIARENIWAIGIYEGSSPIHFSDPSGIENPVISASDVTDVKASFVADPFLFWNNGSWYMFFEVMNTLSNQGDIGLAISADGKKWKYEKIILDEEHHLSYPYVFVHEGEIYLIPESATANQLNLYSAVSFPYEWECVSTLLDGQFGDHGIVLHQGCWYLFACSQPYTHNTLRLYYSDDLFGIFREHPMSPIVTDDANRARPGGRIILWDGNLIRYSQDCSPTYGKSLNAFKITLLTKDKYEEHESPWNPVLKNGGKGWTRHGMHHLDAIQLDKKKWIGCVDGYIRRLIIKVDF